MVLILSVNNVLACVISFPGDANRQICMDAACWGKEKALAACDRLITKGPDASAGGDKEDLAIAYVIRGGSYDEAKQFAKANGDYGAALSFSKTYNILAALGVSYFNRQDYQKSVDFFTQAIKLEPKNPYAYGERADAYQQLNNATAAAADKAIVTQLKAAMRH
jgi:tetratricopeptide (TPR) repeat protein